MRTTTHMMLIGSLMFAPSGCGVDARPAEPQFEQAFPEADQSHLDLRAEGDALLLEYSRGSRSAGPRVVEAFVRHSDNLDFASAEPGPAALAAGKRLVVQRRDAETLRVLLFGSDNVAEFESGTLATLQMVRRDASTATAEILTDKPVFAPQAALDGLRVGDPIEL